MPTFDIDTAFIENLAELLQRTGLTEIEISQGETRIRVAKKIPAQLVEVAARQTQQLAAPAAAGSATPAPAPELAHPGLVKSPMVGTAYLTSEPGEAPFITVGGEVKEGQTLLIIEAMKVMNAIRSPRSGRVTKIFVDNAVPVEFGEPLVIVE